jgi:hypothetical protein
MGYIALVRVQLADACVAGLKLFHKYCCLAAAALAAAACMLLLQTADLTAD